MPDPAVTDRTVHPTRWFKRRWFLASAVILLGRMGSAGGRMGGNGVVSKHLTFAESFARTGEWRGHYGCSLKMRSIIFVLEAIVGSGYSPMTAITLVFWRYLASPS